MHWHTKSGPVGGVADWVDVAPDKTGAIDKAVEFLNNDMEREVRTRLNNNEFLSYWMPGKPERYLEIEYCEDQCPYYMEESNGD